MHCGHECAIQTASNQIGKFTHVGHLASKEAYSVSLRVQFGGIQTGGGRGGGFPQHNLLLSCDYICAEHCEGWWSSGYQCYTRKYYEIVAVCIVMSAQ